MAITLEGSGTVTGITTFVTPLDDIKFDSISVTGIATAGTFQAGSGVSMASPRSQNLALYTNSSEWLTIDDAGNVGFGTTNSQIAADTNNAKVVNAGIVTANQYFGNQLTAVGVRVTGVSTFVDSSTFNNDVVLAGASYNVSWDKSNNYLQWADNAKAVFGASADLSIYHDGSHSYIEDSGTGALKVRTSSFQVLNPAGTEYMINTDADDGVDLYFNNSVKLATNTGGVNVTGGLNVSGNLHCTADGGKIISGAGDDLQLYHSGTNSFLENTTGNLYFRNDGTNTYFQNGSSNKTSIKYVQDDGVFLYFNDAQKFQTTTAGISVSGKIKSIEAGETSLTIGSSDAGGAYLLLDGDSNGDGSGGDYAAIGQDTSGNLIIQSRNPAGTGDITLKVAGTETGAVFTANGAASLYHNNSVRLETTSGGNKSIKSGQNDLLLGSSDAGGVYILLDGDSNGDASGSDYAYIAHDTGGDLIIAGDNPSGDADIIFKAGNNSQVATITSAGLMALGTSSPASLLHLKASGPRITLQDQTSDDLTAKITSSSGALYLQSRNGSSHGEIIFRTENSSAAAERARINPLGNFNINGNLAIASGNTSGDPVIDFAGLTDNGGNNWRKCGVWIMYNGIDTDATDNKSVVYYTGVGAVTTWNWVGDSDTLSNDSFGSVTLQNAAATGFRLYFDVNNQNSGSIVVMIQGWNTKPTITIN